MLSLGRMAEILGNNPGSYVPETAAGVTPPSVVIDSRKVKPGDLFVCIRGERFDGHDFVPQVVEKGASAIIAERDVFGGETPPLAVLIAEDSITAINILASAYRAEFKGRVIGLTGSAGKTSVKEVLAGVLSVRGKTSRNFMNMNNQIGLPISMLNADENALFWVLEAGISEKRDMDELGAVLRPDLGVVLNVGAAHLSGLEDKGVAYYKTRLLTHIQDGGFALVSADYPDLLRESRSLGRELKLFSTRSQDADYYASYLEAASQATGRYRVRMVDETFDAIAPFRGTYGSENVAAIAGAAHLMGLTPQEIVMGLAGASLPAQRFSCQSKGDFTIIDDSYNANPLSAARMLDAATEMAMESQGHLILVMGEMFELGRDCESAHRLLGKQMAESRAKIVLWKGGQSEHVLAGLGEGGFKGIFKTVQDKEEFASLIGLLAELINKDAQGRAKGVIMFKASRGNKLEQLAEVFREQYFANLSE